VILLLDNYDSFTYNLVDYIAQLGETCDVQRNDVDINKIVKNSYDGVILSPGPEEPSAAGILEEVLAYYVGKIPIIGICLGHQAIGQYFGAKLVKAKKPMHGKISKIFCEKHALYGDIPGQHDVVRYNSLLIEDIPDPLQVVASTVSGEVMAIAHRTLPIWGMQYHPEAALSEHGLATLKNWVDTLKVVANP
jgi:anthranilate synthase component 2